MNESKQIDLDSIAEEFSRQVAAGENPSIQEFATRHVEFADEILELFPTLAVITKVLPGDEPEPLPPGDCLKNKTIADFRLIRELGRGGMGVVYEAEQISLGRRVALKVLPTTFLLRSKRKERFDREAKAAGRLHHSNIVPLFGVGNSDGVAFLIMQLIPGVSLDKLIAQLRQANRLDSIFGQVDVASSVEESETIAIGGEHDVEGYQSDQVDIGYDYWRDVASIGKQVAEALQYAHEQGILHRDIKPGNLISDVDQRIWVSDFGLAKIVDSDDLTKTGDVLGTIKYMAPERLCGESDSRSDIYALGTTLYELATLKPAFLSSSRDVFARQLLSEPPTPIRTLRPSIPRDLRTIIEKAMANEPKNRYESAEKLAADLNHFLNDEPIKARPITFVGSTVRWARKNPWLATTVAALTACLFAAAIVSTQAAQHFRQLNSELTSTNESLEVATANAKNEQNLSLQRETRLIFQRGRELAERGKIADGLLLMVNALQQCPENMPDYNRVIRASVSAWSALVPEILQVGVDPMYTYCAVDYCECAGGSGDFFVMVKDKIHRIDATTGKQIGESLEVDAPVGGCWVNSQGTHLALVTKSKPREVQIFNFAKEEQPPTRLTVNEELSRHRMYWHPNGKSLLAHFLNKKSFVVWQDVRSPDYTTHNFNEEKDLELVSLVRKFIPTVELSSFWKREKKRTSHDGRWLFKDQHQHTSIEELKTGNHIRLALPHPMDVLMTVDGGQIQCNHFRLRSFRSSSRFPPSSVDSEAQMGHNKYWNNISADFSSNRDIVVTRDADIVFWGRPDRNITRAAARLWDARTGQPIGRPLQHQFDSVRVVAMNNEGSIAATGGYDFGIVGGAVYLWDTKTGKKLVGPLVHENYVSALAISPDSKIVAAGDYQHKVRFWDVETGKEVGKAIQLNYVVECIEFDPTGKSIAIGTTGEFFSKNQLSVWDVATRQCTSGKMPHPSAVKYINWVPGKNKLVTSNKYSAKIWDLDQPQQPLSTLEDVGRIDCSTVSKRGNLVAIGTSVGSVYLVNTETGKVFPNVLNHSSTVYDLDISSDESMLATGCLDGGLRIWDLATFEQVGPPLMQNDEIFCVRFVPDGKTVASTGWKGRTRTWNVPQLKETPVQQLKRLVEIRTGKRLVNGIAMKIEPREWAKLRAQAIEENIMLDQAASASTMEGMPDLVQVVHPRDLNDARAQDAEQDADWIGAHWHLDRLLLDDQNNGRQSDWQLFARRARTWSERSDFQQAEYDYDSAMELLGDDIGKLTDWYRHRVVTCERSGNWSTALWYLDRILEHDRNDFNSYASRAEVHYRLGNMVQHTADRKRSLAFCDDAIYEWQYTRENKQARRPAKTR